MKVLVETTFATYVAVDFETIDYYIGEGAFVAWDRDIGSEVELLEPLPDDDGIAIRFSKVAYSRWGVYTGHRGNGIAYYDDVNKRWIREKFQT